jgi:hypothetical protein
MSSLSNRLRAQADREVQRIEETIREVYGRFTLVDRAHVVGRFEAFFTKHPKRRATRRDAALHEAGHFVLFEACGAYSNEAMIYGSPSGEWGGEAVYFFGPPDHDARKAQVTLAGPLAEYLLGGRAVHNNVGELFEARFLAGRAARISKGDRAKTWREVVLRTVALVSRHSNDIQDVARQLQCRQHIRRLDPPIDQIIQRIQPAPIGLTAVSDRALEILQEITGAMKELGL